MNQRICPLMSGTPVFNDADKEVFDGIYHCQEHKCQLWIEAYTTEHLRVSGCALELSPQMTDGLFRV